MPSPTRRIGQKETVAVLKCRARSGQLRYSVVSGGFIR